LPEIAHYSSLSEFFEKVDHEHIVVFSTELKESIGFKASSGVNTCAIIGPEGGFSELELNLCQATEKVNLVSLSNPIMKTITAVPFCLGYLQS
jgi:RsmE family RNA methyltransferase